jgi:hypothetical protein
MPYMERAASVKGSVVAISSLHHEAASEYADGSKRGDVNDMARGGAATQH